MIGEEDACVFPYDIAEHYKGKTIVVSGGPYVYGDEVYVKVVSPNQIEDL